MRLAVVVLLFPALCFAQKPTCEAIKKAVKDQNEREAKLLRAEIEPLEKLRESIRRGRPLKEEPKKETVSRPSVNKVEQVKKTLAGKTRREQIALLSEKIKGIEEQIEKIEASTDLPPIAVGKVGDFGSFGKGDVRDFVINEIIDKTTFTAFIRGQRMVIEGNFFRYVPSTGTTLYLVKGIDTTGKADGRLADWDGYLYCSGTQKLELNSGNETVFVLEPFDAEACFKKDSPNQSP